MMATPTRAECCAEARAVLDAARARIAADYSAGRLDPDRAHLFEQLRDRTPSRAAA